jgi:hypothetical protein
MSFWWVQPKASRPRKQKGDQARDLPYARDIKGILDRVQFSGEFATGGVLEVPHNQPPNVQVSTHPFLRHGPHHLQLPGLTANLSKAAAATSDALLQYNLILVPQ